MNSAHLLDYLRRRDGDLIARFGGAQTVRYLRGRFELPGRVLALNFMEALARVFGLADES
jgi:hypothetical protein